VTGRGHWGYDLREDVYVIIKAPQLKIHTRKYWKNVKPVCL
jgi:hypothetical protein